MKIICGLGNPGKEYEATRHNMGFITMEVLAERLGISMNKLKFKALIGEGRIDGEQIILVKPQTYMNNSGESLRELVNFYKLSPEDLMVVYDDIDLPLGTVRVRPFGGPGTHNGMRSIVTQLGTDRFPRVRVGVGGNGQIPLASFVTGRWTEEERPVLADAVKTAAGSCQLFLTRGINDCMNATNKKPHNKSEKKAEENGENK